MNQKYCHRASDPSTPSKAIHERRTMAEGGAVNVERSRARGHVASNALTAPPGATPWPRWNCLNPLSRPSGRSIRRGAFCGLSDEHHAHQGQPHELNTRTAISPTNSAESPTKSSCHRKRITTRLAPVALDTACWPTLLDVPRHRKLVADRTRMPRHTLRSSASRLA